jgi:hypothetical protein
MQSRRECSMGSRLTPEVRTKNAGGLHLEKQGAATMTYRGLWIICRTCLFPIRLPYQPNSSSKRTWPNPNRRFFLACPVCAHVRAYREAKLERVAFRVPDPFRRKRAVLYAVEIGCRNPHCRVALRIYTVAAITVSVASLLELWKHWVIHAHCKGHSLKPLPSRTWRVSSVGGVT